jgi:hypothetical protein
VVVVTAARVVVVAGRVVTVVATVVVVVVTVELVVVGAGSPVPVSVLWTVLLTPQLTVTVPLWPPVAVGANTTTMVQAAVEASTGHVPPVRANGGDTVTEFTSTGDPLLKSSCWGALVSPTATEP